MNQEESGPGFQPSLLGEIALIFFAVVVIVLEGLSEAGGLSQLQAYVDFIHLGAFLLLGIWFFRNRKRSQPDITYFKTLSDRSRWRNLPLLFLIVVTGITAFVAVPNNWDSMTYHLPRVIHWAQNGSLEHYFTGIDRQISQPPGSEMLMLFSYSNGNLSGANLIQWIAYLICIFESGRLVGLLGGGHSAKWSARLLTACLPMAILQSSSTQNDLLEAALVLSAATAGLNAYRYDLRLRSSAFFFLAVGLAILTKGTALIYLPPLMLFFLVLVVRKTMRGGLSIGRVALSVVLLPVVVLLLNIGHWSRNQQTFDSPLGPSYELAADRFDPPAVLASLTKISAQQLRTPTDAINNPMEQFTRWFCERLGAKVDDPSLHWPYGPAFNLKAYTKTEYIHEDYAPAPLHFLLGWIALFWLVRRWWRNRSESDFAKQAGLALAVAGMWLFFAAMLKWQIWHPRLHLPFLVMLVFPAALFLESRTKRVRLGLMAVFFFAALPFALTNSSRPLIGQGSIFTTSADEQRFANRDELLPVYEEAIEAIKARKPKRDLSSMDTGRELPFAYDLLTSGDAWEFPVWEMINRDSELNGSGAHIYHFNPDLTFEEFWANNGERNYPRFFIYLKGEQPRELLFGFDRYELVFQDPAIAVYSLYDANGERVESIEEGGLPFQETFQEVF